MDLISNRALSRINYDRIQVPVLLFAVLLVTSSTVNVIDFGI